MRGNQIEELNNSWSVIFGICYIASPSLSVQFRFTDCWLIIVNLSFELNRIFESARCDLVVRVNWKMSWFGFRSCKMWCYFVVWAKFSTEIRCVRFIFALINVSRYLLNCLLNSHLRSFDDWFKSNSQFIGRKLKPYQLSSCRLSHAILRFRVKFIHLLIHFFYCAPE